MGRVQDQKSCALLLFWKMILERHRIRKAVFRKIGIIISYVNCNLIVNQHVNNRLTIKEGAVILIQVQK